MQLNSDETFLDQNGPRTHDWVLSREEGDLGRPMYTEERQPAIRMKTEEEIGVIQLQAKECQTLLATSEAERGKEGFFPGTFTERKALQTHRFLTSTLQNLTE